MTPSDFFDKWSESRVHYPAFGNVTYSYLDLLNFAKAYHDHEMKQPDLISKSEYAELMKQIYPEYKKSK